MEGALWSLVDESHLGKQPHQSPILEFTHQLRLQPVNGTIQEKSVNKRNGTRGGSYFCVSFISKSALLPIVSNSCLIDLCGDGLTRYIATFFTSCE